MKGTEMNKAEAFDERARHAVYQAIHERRDVRRGFLPEPLPDELFCRLLEAAHSAPSVGLMQPWRFIVVRDIEVRREVHRNFCNANQQAMECYDGERRESYASLKLEGILEAPQNLCIVCDSESSQGHQLGRRTMPETAIYSAVCAVQNLWLAARAEGVGVGWVSILEPNLLRSALRIPEHIMPIAYLCLGYVKEFASEPDLERVGWETRRPLKNVLAFEQYDSTWDSDRRPL